MVYETTVTVRVLHSVGGRINWRDGSSGVF